MLQCLNEGWSEKLKEQSNEGCNISGRIRVNKVIGNIHLSPGKSFQSSSLNVYELVPYLRNDGNRHDFSHTIHQFAFLGDDEIDPRKRKTGDIMKEKLGLLINPLDGSISKVSIQSLFCLRIESDSFTQTAKAQYMFQYFLKVVSTQFQNLDGKTVSICDERTDCMLTFACRSGLTSTPSLSSSAISPTQASRIMVLPFSTASKVSRVLSSTSRSLPY